MEAAVLARFPKPASVWYLLRGLDTAGSGWLQQRFTFMAEQLDCSVVTIKRRLRQAQAIGMLRDLTFHGDGCFTASYRAKEKFLADHKLKTVTNWVHGIGQTRVPLSQLRTPQQVAFRLRAERGQRASVTAAKKRKKRPLLSGSYSQGYVTYTLLEWLSSRIKGKCLYGHSCLDSQAKGPDPKNADHQLRLEMFKHCGHEYFDAGLVHLRLRPEFKCARLWNIKALQGVAFFDWSINLTGMSQQQIGQSLGYSRRTANRYLVEVAHVHVYQALHPDSQEYLEANALLNEQFLQVGNVYEFSSKCVGKFFRDEHNPAIIWEHKCNLYQPVFIDAQAPVFDQLAYDEYQSAHQIDVDALPPLDPLPRPETYKPDPDARRRVSIHTVPRAALIDQTRSNAGPAPGLPRSYAPGNSRYPQRREHPLSEKRLNSV